VNKFCGLFSPQKRSVAKNFALRSGFYLAAKPAIFCKNISTAMNLKRKIPVAPQLNYPSGTHKHFRKPNAQGQQGASRCLHPNHSRRESAQR
jgi:hypothetical protein